MGTYDLLIIFKNDETKTISGVYNHEFESKSGIFSFVKNGHRSFVPVENIKFFGRKFDWEENNHD